MTSIVFLILLRKICQRFKTKILVQFSYLYHSKTRNKSTGLSIEKLRKTYICTDNIAQKMDHARLSIFFESIGESEIHNGIAIWNCLIWTNSDMAMVSLLALKRKIVLQENVKLNLHQRLNLNLINRNHYNLNLIIYERIRYHRMKIL